nr:MULTISPECIES: BON domain-containing protein [unclassified Nesterenkonia]
MREAGPSSQDCGRGEGNPPVIIATRTRSDNKIHSLVLAELEWTPEIDASEVEVEVEAGVVTLSGEVGDYFEYLAASRAMRRVHGIAGVLNRLTVLPRSARWVTDTDIGRVAERVLTWSANIPGTVRSRVEGGCVTLTGQVDWHFQREAAERAVENIRGVHTVRNEVTLIPRPVSEEAAERIRSALFRDPQVDAGRISVSVVGNTAVLTGYVKSLMEKTQAGEAAWSSPDVTTLDNRLDVRPY